MTRGVSVPPVLAYASHSFHLLKSLDGDHVGAQPLGGSMNVVYALTENYYEKILPSVRSLYEHHPSAKLYIVCESDEFPIELPFKPITINVKGIGTFDHSVNRNNMFTYINLFKVCYPSLIRANKVIHLDVDTIIADNIEGLWKTDVTGRWFAACDEKQGRYKPFGSTYYNMGVALINLQQMRKDNIEQSMVDYLNSVQQPWADQDAWNKYGIENDKAVCVDVRYNENVMTGYTDNPAVVHYCSIGDWYENRGIGRREYIDKYL